MVIERDIDELLGDVDHGDLEASQECRFCDRDVREDAFERDIEHVDGKPVCWREACQRKGLARIQQQSTNRKHLVESAIREFERLRSPLTDYFRRELKAA